VAKLDGEFVPAGIYSTLVQALCNGGDEPKENGEIAVETVPFNI
jgi:hypothetical protein